MFFKILFNNKVVYKFRASDWSDARSVVRDWAKRNNYNLSLLELDEV